MANKKLVIDFASLNNCCNSIQNKISQLEEHINNLKNNGQFPINEWNSDGAKTYNKAISEQVNNLIAFKNTLENINSYLSRKASDYKSLDGLK